MDGYNPKFIGSKYEVPLPAFPSDQTALFSKINQTADYELKYGHFSVIMHAARRFPLVSASNISGEKFENIRRKDLFGGKADKWIKDDRIPTDHQWGRKLYGADKSDFDRGHMTKREDVQWGNSDMEADEAARSTFCYTNAVPQHARVNQSIWRSIEDYVLKKEAVKDGLKVNVFTGPILSDDDPEFVTLVQDQKILIPTVFWKIIYYLSEDKILNRVAFMVGQKYLLEKHGITRRMYKPGVTRDRFMNFKQADTYQVSVDLIAELTGWTFPVAVEPFHEERPSKLVLKKIEVTRSGEKKIDSSPKITGLYL